MRHVAIGLLACTTLLAVPATSSGQNYDTVSVDGGGGGGPTPPGGDLSYWYACEAGTINYDYPWYELTVAAALYVDGALLAYDYQSGQYGGELWAWAEATFPATLEDQVVECLGTGQFGGGYDMGVAPGAGPAAVHINIAAFIPYEYISLPGDLGSLGYDAVARGDNRGFGYNEEARVRTRFSLWNSAVYGGTFLNQPDHYAGLTEDFEAESSLTNYPGGWPDWTENAPAGGNLRWEALQDWTEGPPRKIRWGQSPYNEATCDTPQRIGPAPGNVDTSRVLMTCSFRGWHAFTPPWGGPPVEWGIRILVTFGNNEAEVAVDGCATIFPAVEVYAGGGTSEITGEVTILQRGDSGSVLDLIRGCAAGPLSGSGVVR